VFPLNGHKGGFGESAGVAFSRRNFVKQLPTTLAVLKITVLTLTVKNLLNVSGRRVAAKGRPGRGDGGAGHERRDVSLKSF
jgi:hypothetical protein